MGSDQVSLRKILLQYFEIYACGDAKTNEPYPTDSVKNIGKILLFSYTLKMRKI